MNDYWKNRDRARRRLASACDPWAASRRKPRWRILPAAVAAVLLVVFGALLLAAGREVKVGFAKRGTALSFDDVGYPTTVVEPGPGKAHDAARNGPIAFALDSRTKNPAWAMAIITPGSLAGSATRKDGFHADPRVPGAWRAKMRDYADSGFDRGHLIGAAFFGRQQDRDATFALTNMIPEQPDFNRHFWAVEIEERGVRSRVRDDGMTAVLVVVPLYPRVRAGAMQVAMIGDGVWVPERVAAAVLFLRGDKPAFMLAWIAPNEAIDHAKTAADFQVSVDAWEVETRLDVFSALDDEIENRLEAER